MYNTALLNKKKVWQILVIFIAILPLLINGFYLQHISSHLFWTQDIINSIIIPISIYVLICKKNIFSFQKIERKVISIKDQLVYSIFFIVSPFLVYFSGRYVFDVSLFIIKSKPFFCGYGEFVPAEGIMRYFIILYFSFTAAINEELFLRGFFKQIFNNSIYNNISYIIFSALFFSLIHWELGVNYLIEFFCQGVIYAVIYLYTNRISIIIFTHFIIDFFIFSS